MDFSFADALLMASSGKATSIIFLRYVIFNSMALRA